MAIIGPRPLLVRYLVIVLAMVLCIVDLIKVFAFLMEMLRRL